MIFIQKKPYGYIYTDLYKKRCFDTIRDINTNKTFAEFKREVAASITPILKPIEHTGLESVVFVSSFYYDYALGLAVVLPYTETVIEIADDYLAENIYKLADLVNSESYAPYKTYKVFNTASFTEDYNAIPSITRGYLLNKAQFNLLMVAAGLPILP